MLISEEKRFWSKVKDSASGCWEWQGKTLHGYGSFTIGGKFVRAHRWVYQRYVGKIPDGLELDHLCRNRKCVNPAHLEAVTHTLNLLRGLAAKYNWPYGKNISENKCHNGHEFVFPNMKIRKLSDGRKVRRCLICRDEYKRRWREKQKRLKLFARLQILTSRRGK